MSWSLPSGSRAASLCAACPLFFRCGLCTLFGSQTIAGAVTMLTPHVHADLIAPRTLVFVTCWALLLAPSACVSNDRAAQLPVFRQACSMAHTRWAGLLIRLGARQSGLAHAERGVDLNLSSAAAHYQLASAYLLAGETQRAIVELEVTLRLQPDHWQSRRELAQAYLAIGRKRSALEHARVLLAHLTDDPIAQQVLERAD